MRILRRLYTTTPQPTTQTQQPTTTQKPGFVSRMGGATGMASLGLGVVGTGMALKQLWDSR